MPFRSKKVCALNCGSFTFCPYFLHCSQWHVSIFASFFVIFILFFFFFFAIKPPEIPWGMPHEFNQLRTGFLWPLFLWPHCAQSRIGLDHSSKVSRTELWDLQYQEMLTCWHAKSAEWTLKHTTCSEEPQMTSFLSPLVLFTQAKGWNFSMIPSNQRCYSRGWTTSLQSLPTPLHARYAVHTFKWANFQLRIYPSF